MICFVFILNVEHPFKEYNCSIEHVEQHLDWVNLKMAKTYFGKKYLQINFILFLGERERESCIKTVRT